MDFGVLIMKKWIFAPGSDSLERLVRRYCQSIADHTKSGKGLRTVQWGCEDRSKFCIGHWHLRNLATPVTSTRSWCVQLFA